MDIPDCYDPVIQAERIAAAADKNAFRCDWCGDVIKDDAYFWDGDCICERCCISAVKDNFSILEIAKSLGIGVRKLWQ